MRDVGRVMMAAVCTALFAVAGAAGAAAQQASTEVLARGEYLVHFGGCHDCHTPWKMGTQGPEPDMSRALMGHPADMKLPPPPTPQGPWIWSGTGTMTAFAGPWGISYSPNITSDATGIGQWTEQMFIQAMRTGKHTGVGRPILPPMPWQAVGSLNDADLTALFAYLKSVKPVRNVAPPAQVAPPPKMP